MKPSPRSGAQYLWADVAEVFLQSPTGRLLVVARRLRDLKLSWQMTCNSSSPITCQNVLLHEGKVCGARGARIAPRPEAPPPIGLPEPAPRLSPRKPSEASHGAHIVPQTTKNAAMPCASTGQIGEGEIRTHGTVTRTTVFEFYDSHVGLCPLVAKRVLLFAISRPIIPACDAQCLSVPRSWFAIWFANFLWPAFF